MITKNGFTFPLHPFQILSWIIFFIHILIPVLLLYPYISEPRGIVLMILFYLFHAIVLVSAFLATRSIPSIEVKKDPI